jgi:hypothetical protein
MGDVVEDVVRPRGERGGGDEFDAAGARTLPSRRSALGDVYHPCSRGMRTLVIFAASRTVTKDMERIQCWMRQSTAADKLAEADRIEAVGPLRNNQCPERGRQRKKARGNKS